jgi:hypothetical protein
VINPSIAMGIEPPRASSTTFSDSRARYPLSAAAVQVFRRKNAECRAYPRARRVSNGGSKRAFSHSLGPKADIASDGHSCDIRP